MDKDLKDLLDRAAAFHGHLCGGQVIGVRMAVAGLRALQIEEPRGPAGRDLVIFVESDRCPTDAIISVTGRTPGKRSVKMLDYGKTAATFFNAAAGRAVRVSLRGDSEEKIQRIVRTRMPQESEAQARVAALMEIPEEDLITIREVAVSVSPLDLPGESRESAICAKCGESVRDKRHIVRDGMTLCKPCAQGRAYYTPVPDGANRGEDLP